MLPARRQIEFASVTVESLPDGRRSTAVELWKAGRSPTSAEKYVGRAEGADPLRAAAEATVDGLRRALPERARPIDTVNGAQVVEVLGATVVCVAVTVHQGGEQRLTFGFSRVRGYDTASAAARAVLDATNRFLS